MPCGGADAQTDFMADSALALGASRPVGRTRTLRALTRSLDALAGANTEPRTIAAHTGMLLRRALADPSLLEPRHHEPADDRYRQHLVHVHPTGRYSIVALVWKPGQATPIHDHRCWCVVGVWRGLERETTYDLHGDAASAYLVPRGSAVASPGDVSVLVPPVEDIHRVENAGTELAISIHVYGADISVLGSSINREFAEELVRAPSHWQPTPPPVSWRALEPAT
jgi:predicted metal-dependent enzyme (double-stranded beta helix superfamily)